MHPRHRGSPQPGACMELAWAAQSWSQAGGRGPTHPGSCPARHAGVRICPDSNARAPLRAPACPSTTADAWATPTCAACRVVLGGARPLEHHRRGHTSGHTPSGERDAARALNPRTVRVAGLSRHGYKGTKQPEPLGPTTCLCFSSRLWCAPWGNAKVALPMRQKRPRESANRGSTQ